MSPSKRHPVVAELGRPETAQETADRKAQNSREHRRRQTVNNLVYSLLATLGVVILIVLMVPRGDINLVKPVDYRQVAAEAGQSEADPLAVPDLPDTWSANAAQLRTGTQTGGVRVWHIGFISPNNEYIGLEQGFKANDSWIADQTGNGLAATTKTIDGVEWTVYDNRERATKTNTVAYAMTAEATNSTIVLAGTAQDADFEAMAKALAPFFAQIGNDS